MTIMDWNDLANRPVPSLSKLHAANPRTSAFQQQPKGQLQQQPPPSPGFGGTGDAFLTATSGSLFPNLFMTGPRPPAPPAAPSQMNDREENVPTAVRLEDRLEQYEQDILRKVLRDTSEKTIKRTDALLEASVQKAWEQDRQQQIKEWLGPRNNVPVDRTTASSLQGESLQFHQGSPFGGPTAATSLVPQATPPRPGVASPLPIWPEHQRRPPSDKPFDPSQAQLHLNVVQRMTDIKQGVDHFYQISSSSRLGSPLSPVEAGYRSAWLWMKEIIRCSTSGNSAPSSIDQAVASLRHLCTLFQVIILDRSRQGSTNISHTAVYQHDFANQCAVFCQLSLGLTITRSSSPWPTIFYCLRSGHPVAALEVYQKSTLQQSSHHAPVYDVLQVLADAQGAEDCLWHNHRPPHVSQEDRLRIHELWKASQHREPPCDIHEQAVYALLSGLADMPTSEHEGSSLPGLSVIEDYLTFALWKALMPSQQSEQQEKLEILGKTIRQDLGPDYFGDLNSGGWQFAWPLLLTQQYERALTYLVETGGPTGLLQATHVAYLLSCSRVCIHDLGVTSLDVPESTASSVDKKDSLVTTLLVSYAQQLLGLAGPLAAVEYLVRIPDPRQARMEVAKLIATTGQLQQLVGGVNEDGIRIKQGQTIDMHFNHTEVAQILGEAAEMFLRDHRQHSDADGSKSSLASALKCYMLAERYGDLLDLLNQLMSPPENPNSQRSYWLSQMDEFRGLYLTKRTHVLRVLEEQGKMSLAETSRTLVQLNAYFEHVRNQRYEQAWAIIDPLDLLPTSSADMAAKERAYYNLAPVVQASFGAILVSAMDMLHAEHRRLKVERQPATEQVAKKRLKEIQERAKLIVTLAALVNLGNTAQLGKLQRLESLII